MIQSLNRSFIDTGCVRSPPLAVEEGVTGIKSLNSSNDHLVGGSKSVEAFEDWTEKEMAEVHLVSNVFARHCLKRCMLP